MATPRIREESPSGLHVLLTVMSLKKQRFPRLHHAFSTQADQVDAAGKMAGVEAGDVFAGGEVCVGQGLDELAAKVVGLQGEVARPWQGGREWWSPGLKGLG